MIEIVEHPWGYVVQAGGSRETFLDRDNAVLAARILATVKAVMEQRDVDVLVPMGQGEAVRLQVTAAG